MQVVIIISGILAGVGMTLLALAPFLVGDAPKPGKRRGTPAQLFAQEQSLRARELEHAEREGAML